MKKRLTLFLASFALVLLASVGTSLASDTGTDDASQPAYSGGWTNGTNGGTGFLAWNLSATVTSSSDNAGFFIGDSTQLSSPGADINANGDAFGMFGQPTTSGDTADADAYRSFSGGALTLGQTFSLDLAVNFRNGFKGVDLISSGTTVFNLNIGGDDYVVNDAATGTGSIGNTFSTDTAFHLSFTQTSTAGGTWTIARSGGVTSMTTGTYTGDLDELHLYVGGTDSGATNDLFANNFEIVPEPGTWTTLLLGGFGAWVVIRRRKLLVG